MSCVLCGSHNEAEFRAEVMFHFSGLKYLDKPGVCVFPDVMVCLDCGASRFRVPKEELAMLANRGPENERSVVQKRELSRLRFATGARPFRDPGS